MEGGRDEWPNKDWWKENTEIGLSLCCFSWLPSAVVFVSCLQCHSLFLFAFSQSSTDQSKSETVGHIYMFVAL